MTWQSTGISYSVEVSSDAPADQVAHLLEVVDEVAEIPHAIRAGANCPADRLSKPRKPWQRSARTRDAGRTPLAEECVRQGGCGTAPGEPRGVGPY